MEIKCSEMTMPDADDTQWDYIWRVIFIALAFLSIMGLVIVALSILWNKKLNTHHSPMIA